MPRAACGWKLAAPLGHISHTPASSSPAPAMRASALALATRMVPLLTQRAPTAAGGAAALAVAARCSPAWAPPSLKRTAERFAPPLARGFTTPSKQLDDAMAMPVTEDDVQVSCGRYFASARANAPCPPWAGRAAASGAEWR